MDPFAWQPQTPSRARASALLAACAALARQDMPATAAGTPRAADQDPPAACPKQQQEAELQRQEQVVRDYMQQASPCAEPPGCRASSDAPCQLPTDKTGQDGVSDDAAVAMEVELETVGRAGYAAWVAAGGGGRPRRVCHPGAAGDAMRLRGIPGAGRERGSHPGTVHALPHASCQVASASVEEAAPAVPGFPVPGLHLCLG